MLHRRSKLHIMILLVLLTGLASCQSKSSPSAPTNTPTTSPAQGPSATPDPWVDFPPVTGDDPSPRVGVFYYPWYGNVETDGRWEHWEGVGDYAFNPPEDLSSDYYPVLGAYSVNDPSAVAQHMAWMREAGIGVAISSWWGQNSFTDEAIPLMLDMAEHYGVLVAFHIEPYGGRTAESLLDDVKYIYANYGDHPAFYRTTETSYYSPDNREKGLFFLYATSFADNTCIPDPECMVETSYWRDTMDAIHALPDGGIVIAADAYGMSQVEGHFDGVYNYVTLFLEENPFTWSQNLPVGSWYVPSVLAGNSARRIGYSEDTYVPRDEGKTYEVQWSAALSSGFEPQMVTVTSFNEWHEGSQIEPAAENAAKGMGYAYESYAPLAEDGYLTLTRDLVDEFLQMDWSEAAMYPIRIRVTTSSDWTTVQFLEGGKWMGPRKVSVSAEASYTDLSENQILLNQPVERAMEAKNVEVVYDVNLTHIEETLVFGIERGSIGSTTVEIFRLEGDQMIEVATFLWDGNVPELGNMETFELLSTAFIQE